jgi:hypothetical protein
MYSNDEDHFKWFHTQLYDNYDPFSGGESW